MQGLKERYTKELKTDLMKKFDIKNVMAIPVISKVTVNMGLSAALKDSTLIEKMTDIVTKITGQKPVTTKAKKSIASFSIRQGDLLGLKVTLRNDKMYDFVEKLANLVLPQIKDFKGCNPDSFDKNGIYTLGLVDYTPFIEIDSANLTARNHGLSINIFITNSNKEKSKYLLEKIGFIFKKKVIEKGKRKSNKNRSKAK